jgi:hypothetical protein
LLSVVAVMVALDFTKLRAIILVLLVAVEVVVIQLLQTIKNYYLVLNMPLQLVLLAVQVVL